MVKKSLVTLMSWNMQFLNFFLHAYDEVIVKRPVNVNDGSGLSCKGSDHYNRKTQLRYYVLTNIEL